MSEFNALISYLSDLIEKILLETFNDSDIKDLTQQQVHYLKVIVRMRYPTVTELANELKIKKPTVTTLIDKLEKKGYIKRVASKSDRRVTHIMIDEKGQIIQQLRKIASRRLEDTISRSLNETEVSILAEILKKLANSSININD